MNARLFASMLNAVGDGVCERGAGTIALGVKIMIFSCEATHADCTHLHIQPLAAHNNNLLIRSIARG